MKCRPLLDIAVREGAVILELLAAEDETLLTGGDALLLLDLGLDVADGIQRQLDVVDGDGLAGQSLDQDLDGILDGRLGGRELVGGFDVAGRGGRSSRGLKHCRRRGVQFVVSR